MTKVAADITEHRIPAAKSKKDHHHRKITQQKNLNLHLIKKSRSLSIGIDGFGLSLFSSDRGYARVRYGLAYGSGRFCSRVRLDPRGGLLVQSPVQSSPVQPSPKFDVNSARLFTYSMERNHPPLSVDLRSEIPAVNRDPAFLTLISLQKRTCCGKKKKHQEMLSQVALSLSAQDGSKRLPATVRFSIPSSTHVRIYYTSAYTNKNINADASTSGEKRHKDTDKERKGYGMCMR